MPILNNIRNHLRKACHHAQLNLRESFFQNLLPPEDCLLTAFASSGTRFYQYCLVFKVCKVSTWTLQSTLTPKFSPDYMETMLICCDDVLFHTESKEIERVLSKD